MSAPFVLFLLLTGFSTALCLWAAASAALRIPEHGARHRAWTFVGALLLPPTALVVALCDVTGFGQWKPVGAALPVLVIAVTWSNVMTLKDQGVFLKLLHAPVFMCNTTLAGIYLVRAAQDLGGADFGSIGASLTAAHTSLQAKVGHRDADMLPIWLHLPFVLPLCLHFRWTHALVLMISSAMSAALLAMLWLAMPAAAYKVETYRAKPTPELSADVLRLELGVGLEWDRFGRGETEELRQRILALGVDHLTLPVDPELFHDEQVLERVIAELRFLRQRGLSVVAVVQPARIHKVVPAADLHELSLTMARTQWLCAERLQPDVMVLFTGPFEDLALQMVRPGTLTEWTETIRRAATEARQANPRVRLAVSLQGVGPHCEELFRRLKANDSPVDLVGLSIRAGARSLPEVEADLSVLARFCERSPGDRSVQIFEAGAGPHTCGGELGQWNFLATVLRVATDTSAVTGVTLGTLADGNNAFGLLTGAGRPRLAWIELTRLLQQRGARPPR